MKNPKEEFNKLDERFKNYYGPACIGLGLTLLVNSFQFTPNSFSFDKTNTNATYLIIGILFLVLAFLLFIVSKEKSRFKATGLTAGLSIFFFGSHILNEMQNGFRWLGFIPIALGLALIVGGFASASK